MKKVIIYTRVSTKDQSTESQLLKLKEYCKNHNYKVVAKYEDIGTGRNTKRPNYQKLLNDIHLKTFDTLLVWKLNRLSRNTKELIEIGEKLNNKKIDLITYDGLIDTSTAVGKMFYQMLAVIAEFEADNIKENIKAGIDKAKSKGVKIGRPATAKEKLNNKTLEMALSMKRQGLSIRKIAKELNLKTHSNLFTELKKFEEEQEKSGQKVQTIFDIEGVFSK